MSKRLIVTIQPDWASGDLSEALSFLSSLANELQARFPEVVEAKVINEDDRHIIELGEYGWTIQHPDVERDGGELFNCPVTKAAAQGVWLGDFERFGRLYCEWTKDDNDGYCLLIQEPVTP